MSEVTLLDGGMGQDLIRRANHPPTALWSAQVMADEPALVRDLHVEHIAAGADVITVNAYSATRCRLGPAGAEHRFERLQRLACELAVEARTASGRDVRIAGSLSPWGWSYRPELTPPYEQLVPAYAETAALQAPYVDVFICETMGSLDEARAAAQGALATGRPVWVSCTVLDHDGTRQRSGEPLDDACAALVDVGVDALLVNCATPEAIGEAMPVLAATGRRFGGYANGFPPISTSFVPGVVATEIGRRDDVGPERYADDVDRWLATGATIVGGCCEIGPTHIAELRRRLDARAAR